MGRMKTPTEITDKQVRNLSAAVPEIERGVNAVDVAPTALAAERLDVAQENYRKSIESGKMARNLKAVSLEEWKAKTAAKATRIPEGIEQSRAKLMQFHEQRNAAQSAIDGKIAAIPKRTLADSIRRMTTQVEEMSKFSFDRSR